MNDPLQTDRQLPIVMKLSVSGISQLGRSSDQKTTWSTMSTPDFDEPMIDLRDVSKRFAVGGSDLTILRGISLHIHAGEFVAIVGPSGSGKSTLLNMITGIDRPSAGEVMVLGQPVHALSENKLAQWRGRSVGMVTAIRSLAGTWCRLND